VHAAKGLIVGALLVVALGSESVRATGGADAPPLADLLTRAGEHVRQFEVDFARVVSDEDYKQQAKGRLYASSQSRRTQSEMVFMWLPDEGGWLTVRNVLTADGKRVPDRQDRLNDLLRETASERLLRLKTLLNESARFNVGHIFRNFNYPTLALSYLDPAIQPRFAFTLGGRERVNGVQTWKVAYVERARPTVIQETATPGSVRGIDLTSRGTLWIGENGIVHKTVLEVQMPRPVTMASIEVIYRRDDKLEMWVPMRMHETYLQARGTTINETIDCVASYSNFRRFETSGRIIPPNEPSP
jgi:hypothetical protein